MINPPTQPLPAMPTLVEVQSALQRCLTAEPPVDQLELSPDSAKLAEVFAEMRYEQQTERDLAAFKPSQLEAFERWR